MPTIDQLARRLDDAAPAAALCATLRALAATRDPAAIAVIATMLDSAGVVGNAAVEALVSFGDAARPEMRRCIDTGIDEDGIRNAFRVLAALGDVAAADAQHADCWAELDGPGYDMPGERTQPVAA